jgi:hypothetical protein
MLMYRHARDTNMQRVSDDIVPAKLKATIDVVVYILHCLLATMTYYLYGS